MDLRKEFGGKLEEALNQAVDKHLDAAVLKEKLHAMVDDYVDMQLVNLKHMLKADVIDVLDGEDDIK